MADPSHALIQAALLETLDSVVSPDVRQDVITAALAEAEDGVLPVDVYGFRRFVRGPLRDALVRVLGRSLAETVTVELELMGCSIPPTVRPSAMPRFGGIGDPVIPPHRVPRSLTPMPPHRTSSSSSARRSSPPVPRRSFSPWPGNPVPRGSVRASRPSAELDDIAILSANEAPTAPSARSSLALPPPGELVDPLADLPPLHPPDAEPRPVPRYSGAARAPHAAAFLAGPFLTPVPPAPSELTPLVIVATRDAELVATLTEWLGARAEIRVVTDILDLVASPHNGRRVLLVIDCNRPSVRPVAVAALSEELPPQATVLLWAPSEDDELALRTVAPEAEHWRRCTAAAAAQLAMRCVELVV